MTRTKRQKQIRLRHEIRVKSIELKIKLLERNKIKVFINDTYICPKCDKKTNTLELHHIRPVREAMVRKDIPKFASEDNVKVLCIKCHKGYHKYQSLMGNEPIYIER